MAYSDDYRALIEDARDAVRKLLDASHHDSWMRLRYGYGQIRDQLLRDDEERQQAEARADAESTREAKQARDAEFEASREWRRAWHRTPMARREGLLFDVLADERLTIREILGRLNKIVAPGYSGRFDVLGEQDVRTLTTRMLRAGHLERTGEPFQGKVRYRYWRSKTLEGKIADLDRAYHDNDKDR